MKHSHADHAHSVAFWHRRLAQLEVVVVSWVNSGVVSVLRRWAKSRPMPAVTIPADKKSFRWQIEATYRQMDALVCDLPIGG